MGVSASRKGRVFAGRPLLLVDLPADGDAGSTTIALDILSGLTESTKTPESGIPARGGLLWCHI